MNFIEALIALPIFFNAFAGALISSFLSGIIGSYVVVKRISLISGSISHAVLGGIGFALWLERVQGITFITPLGGALIAAVLSAIFLSWIHITYREREDAVIAALWSFGMAVGVIFIAKTPGFNVELTNFLVGNLFFIAREDLYLLLGLSAIVLASLAFFHQRFLAIAFDEENAQLQNISVPATYTLLLLLIAVAIVLLIYVVGVLLVLAMLTLPPSTANLITHRLSNMMVAAVIISIACCSLGMVLAFHLNWPSGATIALLASVLYSIILIFKKRARHLKK